MMIPAPSEPLAVAVSARPDQRVDWHRRFAAFCVALVLAGCAPASDRVFVR